MLQSFSHWWPNTGAQRLFLALLILPAAGALPQEPDHTTYIIRTPNTDVATLRAIEATGAIVDHYDGNGTRAYVLHTYWPAFQAANIPYTLEAMQPPAEKQATDYPSYAEVGTQLSNWETAYPQLCRRISIGQSVQGRELWALQITDNPGVEEDEPEFAYLSTIHGDETIGTILCLNFIETLLTGYGSDAGLTSIIDETDIWILPILNPDGYEMGIRWNANNLDLNRSFPEWPIHFSGTLATEPTINTVGLQPEVARVIDWSMAHRFVLMANYHSGALLVNYPYDEEPDIPSGQEAPTPDDDLMRSLATTYARLNPPMAASRVFPGGIVNGSRWYRVSGGMQDWHYRYAGAIDFTLEVSTIKSPATGNLLSLWDDNKDGMRAYLDRVHRGIRGIVADRATGAPLAATITVADNPQPVFTDPEVGDFYRLLLPGTYTVHAEAPGYIPFTTPPILVGENSATRHDISLSQGDVDGNGQVDAVDLQLVVNNILGRDETPAADVDGNGVSATDLQHLVNRVLGRP